MKKRVLEGEGVGDKGVRGGVGGENGVRGEGFMKRRVLEG